MSKKYEKAVESIQTMATQVNTIYDLHEFVAFVDSFTSMFMEDKDANVAFAVAMLNMKTIFMRAILLETLVDRPKPPFQIALRGFSEMRKVMKFIEDGTVPEGMTQLRVSK